LKSQSSSIRSLEILESGFSNWHRDSRSFVLTHRIDVEIVVLESESTKTSALASLGLNSSVAEIAKTIAFVSIGSEQPSPILVVLSGDMRVNSQKLMRAIVVSDRDLKEMSADEVREFTGTRSAESRRFRTGTESSSNLMSPCIS
jgi:hypothetical protein